MFIYICTCQIYVKDCLQIRVFGNPAAKTSQPGFVRAVSVVVVVVF